MASDSALLSQPFKILLTHNNLQLFVMQPLHHREVLLDHESQHRLHFSLWNDAHFPDYKVLWLLQPRIQNQVSKGFHSFLQRCAVQDLESNRERKKSSPTINSYMYDHFLNTVTPHPKHPNKEASPWLWCSYPQHFPGNCIQTCRFLQSS